MIHNTAISFPNDARVVIETIDEQRDERPLVVRAERPCSLADWAASNQQWLDSAISACGAVLLRGFSAADPINEFRSFCETALGELAAYTYRSTPRTSVADRLYTTTEYPADFTIPQHSENAYARRWPSKLALFCVEPAQVGGQTPLSYNSRVLKRLSPATVQSFRSRGVTYVRNYDAVLDLPWDIVFQTEDRAEVEAYCVQQGIEFEWRNRGRLRTRQRCQAVLTHPVSGHEVWFNQAHLFHVSALDPETREAMTALFSPEDLPRNAYFGDGGELEIHVLEEIRRAFEAETLCFDWTPNDALLVDNVAVSHGRKPYAGSRKVLVAMSAT